MVFSSIFFLLYFLPFFLIIYHFIDNSYKNVVILVSSLFFYAWGEPIFIFTALASIFVDFFIVRAMVTYQHRKKLLLWCSIVLNVGLLLYFKYANFFVENINTSLNLLGYSAMSWASIALPIGLSFFTFQKLSYSIDIYRQVGKPLKNLQDYTVYILLFPQLIAGPIVRYSEIEKQLKVRDDKNINDKIYGFYRFSIGLAKKVLIANVLGEKADLIFELGSTDLSGSIAWFGIVCYTFQIYFDFSGYSDMAIGLGKLMGFKFPENFNSPYIAQSVTEFWRRWHITLSSWMRDYLYIPLGGSRVNSRTRLYMNLWLVFLLSGFWHGASWNFIIWGLYHGFFLVADRIFLKRVTSRIGILLRIILTFFIVINGWVLFRAETLNECLAFYKAMYTHQFDINALGVFLEDKIVRTILIAIFLSFAFFSKKLNIAYEQVLSNTRIYNLLSKSVLSILLFVFSVSSLVSSDFNPFIYFRF